jgi:hypothetical protein
MCFEVSAQNARSAAFNAAVIAAAISNRRASVVGKTVCMDILARQLTEAYRVQDVLVCSTHKE